jgi:hypothetical protein
MLPKSVLLFLGYLVVLTLPAALSGSWLSISWVVSMVE